LYRKTSYSGTGTLNGFTAAAAGDASNWQFPLVAKYRFAAPVVRPYVEAGIAWNRLGDVKQSLLTTAGIGSEQKLKGDTVKGLVIGAGIDIHAVTADEVAIRNLSLCVERCHLGVSGLVAAPYASALAVITPDEAKLGVACIDFGAGTTTLSVFSDGHFIHTDAIALGGAGITTDIARSLGAPLEHAERLKTLHGSAFATLSDEREIITFPSVGERQRGVMNQSSKAQLAVLIRPRVEEILDLMRRRLASCAHASEAAQTLVLTGGGSQLTGLAELASNMFGRPVRLGRPRTLNGLPESGTGPDFSSAVGVLKQWARGDDKLSGRAEQRFLRTGTGYLARVSEWIRDNF
jgi:cell division protein FtsA